MATSNTGLAREGGFLTTAMLDTERLRYLDRSSTYGESRAITDATGAFELTGLASSEYALVSLSTEWFWAPPKVCTGEHHVIRARAPIGIQLRVSDATSKEPIPRIGVELDGSQGLADGASLQWTRSGSGRDGEAMIAWVPESDAAGSVQTALTVSAQGYRSHLAQVELEVDGLTHIQLELEPLQLRAVRLLLHYDTGELPTEPLDIGYVEPGGGQSGSLVAHSSRPGVYLARLPLGRWFLNIRPSSDLRVGPAWRGELLARLIHEIFDQASPSRCLAVLCGCGHRRRP